MEREYVRIIMNDTIHHPTGRLIETRPGFVTIRKGQRTKLIPTYRIDRIVVMDNEN